MSEKEPLRPRVIELSPEDEERFAEVANAVAETVESLEMFVSPGYPFALHPGSFAEAEEFVKDEKRMPDILLLFALRALGMSAVDLELVKEQGEERWFRTSKSGVLLGTDGIDWWLEIVSVVAATEPEEAPVI